MLFEILVILWYIVAFAMSAALTKCHPEISGWGNVSRSMAWPVTIYEIKTGK